MTWNHRITRETLEDGTHLFALREVFYEGEQVVSWTQEPIAAVGETFLECADTLAKMNRAVTLGVLDLETRETVPAR